MQQPLVSIIIPAYNAEDFIAETILSVKNQTYTNWELIIIDDESKDSTASIIKEFQKEDGRIRYVWQKNGRQANARNNGINISKGDFIAFLDADDVWLPHKLTHQLKLMAENNADLIFGYSYLIEKNVKTQKIDGRGQGIYKGKAAVDFLLLKDSYLMSTVLVKSEAVKSVGLITEIFEIPYGEDWHLYLKIALKGYSAYTDGNVVAYYRLSDNSACAVESDPKVKLSYVLLDLNLIFPNHSDLINETLKRLKGVVLNSVYFDESYVRFAIDFVKNAKLLKLPIKIYLIAYKININLFRKVFLNFTF